LTAASDINSTNYAKHTQSKGLRRKLIDRFNQRLIQNLDIIIPAEERAKKRRDKLTLLDYGCGEGFVLSLIAQQHPQLSLTGCDINQQALDLAAKAVPSANFFICNSTPSSVKILKTTRQSFDIVLCTEVLEHVPHPEQLLQTISRLSRKFVILSVPHEPFFTLGNLASGKYLSTFGNHPEHIQHFSKRKFRNLCNQYFKEVEYTSVFPWLLYIGSAKTP
jgi:2-polyprenyl-3-methyl-5-hydroxy-6-metoxy-1,4-benzoquinol methylase